MLFPEGGSLHCSGALVPRGSLSLFGALRDVGSLPSDGALSLSFVAHSVPMVLSLTGVHSLRMALS